MAQTERVTILMEPEEKTALTRKARAEGVKVGEYIRKRVLNDRKRVLNDADRGAAVLLELVRDSTKRASRGLDDALAAIAQSRAEAPARQAAATEKARREFASINFAALNLLGEQVPARPLHKAG